MIVMSRFVYFFGIALSTLSFSLYSYLNSDISDPRAYFYFFEKIVEDDFINFIISFYVNTGKLEIIQALFFNMLYLTFGQLGFFEFIIINYLLIFSLFYFLIKYFCFTFSIDERIRFFSICFITITLWLPSYLNVIWLWRTNLSYVILFFAILSFINKKNVLAVFFTLIAFFTHYSSAAVLLLFYFLYIIDLLIYRLSISLKLIIIFIASIIIIFFYDLLKNYFVSGMDGWESAYYMRFIILSYFFIGILFILYFISGYSKIKFEKISFIRVSLWFFIICLILASFGVNNYQDSFRIMHFSYFLFCFISTLVVMRLNGFTRIIFSLYLSVGIFSGFYLISGFLYSVI